MAHWVGSVGVLTPFTDALGAQVLAAEVVHAVGAPLLALAHGLGKTTTARPWTYMPTNGQPAAVRSRRRSGSYSSDRMGGKPQRRPAEFSATLRADPHARFTKFYHGGPVRRTDRWRPLFTSSSSCTNCTNLR